MTQDDPSLAGIEAVLLDMDGTLVDSDAAVVRAWTRWAEEYDVDADAIMAVAHGSPAERTVRAVRPDLDEDGVQAAAARQLALQYDDLSDVVAAPGAPELIELLRQQQIPWAIITSADARLAAARLEAASIDAPLLITVEDVSRGKPDPEGYLAAARRLGVDPDRCLVVEDAEPGIVAGHAAGAKVAALKGLSADLTIASLSDLIALLEDRD